MSDTSIRVDADFEGGSAGEIRPAGKDAFEALPLPEPVPDWFSAALEEHFGGAGVPREYACHVRLASRVDQRRTVRLRFRFTETSGAAYMAPPYWLFRRCRWRPVPARDTEYVEGSHVDLRIRLAPGEQLRVANKPYVSMREVYDEMGVLAASGPFEVREIGRTAGSRPIMAVESTGGAEETILIGATMQPAEPAARPVLAIAHWLTDGSALTRRLLERFRFAFVPLPNPDGTAGGRSCTNGGGEVPMFSFGRLLAGEAAPAETRALWEYAEALRPLSYLELHTHYQDVRAHKLNPMAAEWFADPERRELAQRVDAALLSLNADWRVTAIERATPLSGAGGFSNLAERFGTLAYCYQIYCVTEEATCAHAVSVARTLAAALAGPEWEAAAPPPNIEKG